MKFVYNTIIIGIILIIVFPIVVKAQEKPYIPLTTERLYIDILKHNDNRKRRAEAAYQLGRVQSKIATDELIHAMNNDDSILVKEACAYSLGVIGGDEELDSLINVLSRDAIDSKVIIRAMYSISKIDGKNHTNLFVSMLDSSSEDVRIEAIKILGRYKNQQISDIIIDKINSETNPNIIKYGIISLAKHENINIIPFIIDIYTKTNNNQIRASCATALYHLNYYHYSVKLSEYVNQVNGFFNNNKTLFYAYCLSFIGSRSSYGFLYDVYNNPQSSIDDKNMVLEALSVTNFLDVFDVLFDALSKKTYEFNSSISFLTTINAEKVLLDGKIDIIVRSIINKNTYNSILKSSLNFKIYNNPYNVANKINPFLRQDDYYTNEVITDVILSLEEDVAIDILSSYLKYESIVLKVNTFYILSKINTDNSFEIIYNNVLVEDSDFKVRTFRRIDSVPNHRLTKLFLDNLTYNNTILRKQSLNSLINCAGSQMNYISVMYRESLGRINDDIKKRIENLRDTSIIPLYSLFTSRNLGVNREIIPNFVDFYNELKNIDSSLVIIDIPVSINNLLWDYGVDFLNGYRVTLFYDSDFYNDLYTMIVRPILNYTISESGFRDDLKLMYIPVFSRIENDDYSNESPRDKIMQEIKNNNPDIVMVTARSLVYLFRTMYRPVKEENLVDFRQFLSRKIIQLTQHLNYFKKNYESYQSDETYHFYIPKDDLSEIIEYLERAMAEAIVVDKTLYINLLYKDLDPELIRLMILNVKVISKHEDVINTLIEISGSEIAYIRYEALKILAKYINNPKVYNVFISKIGDEDEDVSNLVVNTLSDYTKKEKASQISGLLLAENPDIIEDAEKILVEYGDTSVNELLILFDQTNIVSVKRNVISILGKINTIQSNEALMRLIKDAPDNLKIDIIIVLINNLNKEIIEKGIDVITKNLTLDDKLIEYLQSDDNVEKIKNSILIIIENLNTYNKNRYDNLVKILSILGLYHIDVLIDNLANKNYLIRKGIEDAIKLIGKESTTDRLIQALKRDNSNIVSSSINILSYFGESIIDYLKTYINSDNINIRYGISTILSKIRSEKAVYLLIVLLYDDYWRIKTIAKRSLINNFGFSSEEVDILSNLDEDEIQDIEEMSIEEIREKYL